jgi:hypothetical protein
VLSADVTAPHPDEVRERARRNYEATKDTEMLRAAKRMIDAHEELRRSQARARARGRGWVRAR